MIEGKTKTGFEFNIDERALEDWALIELTKKYDKGNSLKKAEVVPEITNLLLGEGGFKKLEKHIRACNDGFCPIKALESELLEIINSNKVKN